MDSQFKYPLPEGLYEIPHDQLDLRPDAEIDEVLTHPTLPTSDKNLWFYWNSGFSTMHGVSKRTVRTWHRRFSKQGWTVYLLDSVEGSPSHISNFLDVNDPETFPIAFRNGTLGGGYSAQHTSDLIRFPLLVKYGGLYVDVSVQQIGDLDRVWMATVDDPTSPYEVLTYELSQGFTNYFFGCNRGNAYIERCHRLLLKIWDADGGKTDTEGMHRNPLVKEIPLLPIDVSFEENGRVYSPQEVSEMLTDYMIQVHVMAQVFSTEDLEDNWNGPEYKATKIYAIEGMTGSQMFSASTAYNGEKAFEMMCLHLPKPGEEETPLQKETRELLLKCLQQGWGFKQGQGLILRVIGESLGTLWRKHEGSDNVPGTYSGWLRHATLYWNQKEIPLPVKFEQLPPLKKGRLLE